MVMCGPETLTNSKGTLEVKARDVGAASARIWVRTIWKSAETVSVVVHVPSKAEAVSAESSVADHSDSIGVRKLSADKTRRLSRCSIANLR